MNVTRLPEVVTGERTRRVAIGTFDGVHLGHREVIRGNDTVLTFDPHPLSVIHPEATPKLLNPFTVKRDLIAGLGVEELVVIPFDRHFASLEAEEFAEQVLVEKLGAAGVSVGENFRFGKGARGTPEFLGARPEFETRVVPLVEVAGRPSRRATSAGSWPPARWPRRPSSWAARSSSTARSCPATGAAANWACPPPTSCPTTAW